MVKFPNLEQWAKDVAEKAFNEIIYNGKSIREWAELIVEQEPKMEGTRGDIPIQPTVPKMPKADILDKRVKSGLNRVKDELEPCEDCISRKEVIENIRHAQVNFSVESDIDFTKHKREVQEIADGILNAQIQVLENMPSVTPQEPKTGWWTRELIRNEYGGCIGGKMICSECGQDNGYDKRMKFCPNCGAKMETNND